MQQRCGELFDELDVRLTLREVLGSVCELKHFVLSNGLPSGTETGYFRGTRLSSALTRLQSC